jgi:hypothetical protein
MNCLLKFAVALLLGYVPAWCEQAKEPVTVPAKPPAPTVKPVVPKVPAPKSAPARAPASAAKAPAKSVPIIRPVPTTQVQRFLRLTPKEREIAIDKMPVASQDAIRKRLAAFDSLPAQEREHRLKLYDAISKLPKATQDLVNARIDEFQKLGPDRRGAIQRAYQLLSGKAEPERRVIIDSPEFKERFTPTEQRIVVDLVKYYPTPEM